ncbi:unnamed protein product [Phyllotreta striolata]|uniref:Uncharacterized protein n=1 Tax=Phyllotreta striolata TaxID=444603 RepID=A0A9N9TNX2_PHYSR|nr:unnamed protein product [Phyllotreta striolata]
MKPLLISFVVALVLIGAAECISDEIKAKLMEIQKECMSESGITDVVIRQALQGDELTAEMQVNAKSHAFCFAKKLGIMNDDGTFNTEAFMLHHWSLRELTNACIS